MEMLTNEQLRTSCVNGPAWLDVKKAATEHGANRDSTSYVGYGGSRSSYEALAMVGIREQ